MNTKEKKKIQNQLLEQFKKIPGGFTLFRTNFSTGTKNFMLVVAAVSDKFTIVK